MSILKTLRNRVIALSLFILVATFDMSANAQTTSNNQPIFEQARVENSVRKELLKLPYFGVFDNLAFRVDGATVTLYGQVVRPSTKSDAESRVRRIKGIEQVVNSIEVLPLSRFDDDVRLETYRAIANTGGLYRYVWGANPSLHIVVNRGHVTLEGVVANTGDRRLAEFAARSVFGSFSVTNNLVAESERRRNG